MTEIRLAPHARDAVRDAAESLVPELDEVAEQMARAIHDGIAELSDEIFEDTAQSCRSNIAIVCAMMRDGLDASDATGPPEALHYAREYVRHGHALEVLMRAYRIGHQTFYRVLVTRLEESIDDYRGLPTAVRYASDWTFAYVDAVSSTVAAAYISERERWVRSAAAVRAEQVAAILDGRPTDEDVASRRLRYELRRRHLALVMWGGDSVVDADGTAAAFERLAQVIAARLGSGEPLCVPLGGLVVAAWIGLHGGPTDLPLDEPLPGAAECGARIAVGEVHEGLAGFRRSHEEALLARRVAMLAQRAPGAVVHLADAGLTALLTADLSEARQFVRRELGELAADNDSSRRLAATLDVFFDEGASHVKAARRLGIHENTVAYRVRRAAEILEHPLDERQLEVRSALRLAAVLRMGSEPDPAARQRG